MLTKELQEYYEELFSMFATKGWEFLAEDMKRVLDQVTSIDASNNEQELFVNKGRTDILRWVLGFKEMATKSYEDLTNENPS